MTTPTLPTDLGGYQHLEPNVISESGDIIVRHGKPLFFNPYPHALVRDVEAAYQNLRVYRKMPCPRQGGDRPLTAEEQACQQRSNTGPLRIEPTYKGPTQSFHRSGPTGLSLPTEAKARKGIPIATGFVDYFPKTIAAVARLSQIGNEQHNPGAPLHWDRSKSGDEADAFMRHFLQRNELDSDGVPHVVKCAWRANAMAQKYLERNPWP